SSDLSTPQYAPGAGSAGCPHSPSQSAGARAASPPSPPPDPPGASRSRPAHCRNHWRRWAAPIANTPTPIPLPVFLPPVLLFAPQVAFHVRLRLPRQYLRFRLRRAFQPSMRERQMVTLHHVLDAHRSAFVAANREAHGVRPVVYRELRATAPRVTHIAARVARCLHCFAHG